MDVTLARNIKPKPPWWDAIPVLGSGTAQAIYPNIWLPRKIFDNLASGSPNPRWLALLAHEQIHLEREQKIGPWLFRLKYCILRRFRFEEEIAADVAAMRVYRYFEIEYDIEARAKFLASWVYLWCVDYHTAKRELDKAWVRAKGAK